MTSAFCPSNSISVVSPCSTIDACGSCTACISTYAFCSATYPNTPATACTEKATHQITVANCTDYNYCGDQKCKTCSGSLKLCKSNTNAYECQNVTCASYQTWNESTCECVGSAPSLKLDYDSGSLTSGATVKQSLFFIPTFNISPDNYIGIGTTSPSYKFQFASSSNQLIDVRGGYIGGLALTPTNNDHAASKYYVDNNFLSKEASSSLGWLLSGNTLTSDTSWLGSINNYDFLFKTNNIERMRILKGGNIGIGATNPAAKLTISGTDNKIRLTYDGNASTSVDFISNASGQLRISPVSGSTYLFGGGVKNYLYTYDFSNSRTNYSALSADILALQNASNLTNVYINANGWSYLNGGNVGIGTTTPAAKLQINPPLSTEGLRIVSSIDYSPFVIRNNSDTLDFFRINQNGFVGISSSSPSVRLSISSSSAEVINVGGGSIGGLSLTPLNNDQATSKYYVDSNFATKAVVSSSSVSKYVGTTTLAYDGNQGGYDGANTICSTQYGSGAHVCTSFEMLNSIAAGLTMPKGNAWIVNGPPGYTTSANDCDARTLDTTTEAFPNYGTYWEGTDLGYTKGRGLLRTCDKLMGLACCN